MRKRQLPLGIFGAVLFAIALLNGRFAESTDSANPEAPPSETPVSAEKPKAKKPAKHKGTLSVTLSEKDAPSEQELRKAVAQPVEVNFAKVPLNTVIGSLAKATGVNFWIDEQALTEEGVAVVEPISLQGKPIAAARVLDRILPPLGLTWIIQDNVVQITTIIAAEEKLITRTYPVGHLIDYAKKLQSEDVASNPSRNLQFVQFGDSGGICTDCFNPCGESVNSSPESWLIDTLQQMTDGPWADTDGTGGTISYINKNLVIRQTQKGQQQCEKLIDTIRQFTKGDLPPNPTAIRPPHYATEEDEAVKKALTKVISVKAQDTPLDKFLTDLAKTLDVPLYLYKQALTEEGVAVDEPINLELKNLPARSLLEVALTPLGLRAIIEDGQLFVSTIIEIESRIFTTIHDIRELEQSGYPGGKLIDLLYHETYGPWLDVDGSGGEIMNPIEGLLLVRNTPHVQDEVEAVLADLRKQMAEAPQDAAKKEPEDPQNVTTKFYHLENLGDANSIQTAILKMVEPKSWTNQFQPGGEGQMVLIDTTLVVKNRNEVHEKVKEFLRDYQQAVVLPFDSQGFGGGGLGQPAPAISGGGGFFQIPPAQRNHRN